jgi:hypothetical protein
MLGARRVVSTVVISVSIGAIAGATALAAGSRVIKPRHGDQVWAQRLDLQCLYTTGTTSGAFICYRRSEPKESVYVEFRPTFVRLMRFRAGGLVEIARYRR